MATYWILLTASIMAALGLLVAACADLRLPAEPDAPAPGAEAAAADGYDAHLVGKEGWLALPREGSAERPVSRTATIGPLGGVIRAGSVTLTIPVGALTRRVSITVTDPGGPWLEGRFQPHGLRFAVPALVSYDLSGTPAASDESLRLLLRVVYVGRAPIGPDGLLDALDVLGVQLGGDRAAALIGGFSGYIVATGRSGMVR